MSPLLLICIILAYFALLILISVFTGKKADNSAFFLGNKKSPWFVVAFGMIGASLSGVTFISVPGWVGSSQFSYMQMVMGYFFGYLVIANILMPMYYRLKLTSIYTYLEQRFGESGYLTGSVFFLISRIIGSAFRLFLVASVLQYSIFSSWNVPFYLTVVITILLIWLYTFRGGIKTIIWTDSLQTIFMLSAIALSFYLITRELNLSIPAALDRIAASDYSRIFFFDDFKGKQHFIKQFLSGMFITIVMTGLDQDMMQKNLSCKNISEAKKNMYWFSALLIPVNLVFLGFGALLYIYATTNGISIPDQSDNLFPMLATGNYFPPILGVLFMLGLIAAAYSSADSALTALTTSFSIDILKINKKYPKEKQKQTRMLVHAGFSLLLFFVILIFKAINDQNVISAIFTAAGYTYGPLLGLYAFGLFTRFKVHDKYIPIIAIISPLLSYLIKIISARYLMWEIGFELLIINGIITFIGLCLIIMRDSGKLA